LRRARDQIDIDLISKQLRLDDEADRDVVASEAGAVEALGRVGCGAAEAGEHLGVMKKVPAEHLGDDKHELS
jgi:hypothetical protein